LRDVLIKRLQSADTLREILERIDDAQTNKKILDAYKLGTGTLKSLTEQYGLTPEAVDKVMIDLDEVLADQREIDAALIAGSKELGFNEEELSEELNNLAQQIAEEEEVKMEAMLGNLKVASDSPTKPVQNDEKKIALTT